MTSGIISARGPSSIFLPPRAAVEVAEIRCAAALATCLLSFGAFVYLRDCFEGFLPAHNLFMLYESGVHYRCCKRVFNKGEGLYLHSQKSRYEHCLKRCKWQYNCTPSQQYIIYLFICTQREHHCTFRVHLGNSILEEQKCTFTVTLFLRVCRALS